MSEITTNRRSRLRKLLKEDATWLKYRSIVRNSWPTEFDGFEQEIMDIQKVRPIRLLGATGGKPSGRKLTEATLADTSHRSRCVEMTMMVIRVKAHLDMARALCKKHILANYQEQLNSWGLRGVRERETLVSSLFDTADELLARYQTILDLADWVIDDVDAGGFSLQKALKSLEAATKREYGV